MNRIPIVITIMTILAIQSIPIQGAIDGTEIWSEGGNISYDISLTNIYIDDDDVIEYGTATNIFTGMNSSDYMIFETTTVYEDGNPFTNIINVHKNTGKTDTGEYTIAFNDIGNPVLGDTIMFVNPFDGGDLEYEVTEYSEHYAIYNGEERYLPGIIISHQNQFNITVDELYQARVTYNFEIFMSQERGTILYLLFEGVVEKNTPYDRYFHEIIKLEATEISGVDLHFNAIIDPISFISLSELLPVSISVIFLISGIKRKN
ncbi:MAG: hypothetical protein OEZ01_11050, partial [Candidatus Heimdallarchaeota archaeon]|nr:hypothetical protein [Candidatus Heimdallarchaeota archaeon]